MRQADGQDVRYWWGKTPTERIAGIEAQRRWPYDAAAVNARLQRVFEFAKLGDD